jgi:hypothetical protein
VAALDAMSTPFQTSHPSERLIMSAIGALADLVAEAEHCFEAEKDSFDT